MQWTHSLLYSYETCDEQIFEKCLTSVVYAANQFLVHVNRNTSPVGLHTSSAFPNFASEKVCLMSPHPSPNFKLPGLQPRCSSMWVHCLVETPFPGAFSLQHKAT
ncbi:hypothetical protein GOODEAATRI_023862 [Goodea atripinnis]|uniref:Uncharacterized protein n=1 Tax=Goodea atripinnis TaxID=208336 RepID=A0ABV0MK86_9TELE